MPTYEYECEHCGFRFERSQAITARPIRKCERCGGPVHRLISPVWIIFKGPGFHVNDYSKTGPKCGGADGRKNGRKKAEDMADTIKSTASAKEPAKTDK